MHRCVASPAIGFRGKAILLTGEDLVDASTFQLDPPPVHFLGIGCMGVPEQLAHRRVPAPLLVDRGPNLVDVVPVLVQYLVTRPSPAG